MDLLRSVSFIFLIVEMVMGLVCFAIEVGYEISTLFIRYYSYHYMEANAREYLVRTRLVYCTVTAFPFIVLPTIIITIILTRKTSPFSVMSILVGIVGTTLYITSGAVALASANLTWVSYGATQTFGGIAITTGIIYLAHIAYEILRNKNDDSD